jgi:hypothetical protein
MESTTGDRPTGRHHRIARNAAKTTEFLRGVRLALEIGAAGHGRTQLTPRAAAGDETAPRDTTIGAPAAGGARAAAA